MATILVVDDRPANREFLVALLGSAGHRVTEAAGGAEALAIVRTHHPDLVISDILMPAMLGARYAVLGVPAGDGLVFCHWLTSGFDPEAAAPVGTPALGEALLRMVYAKSLSIQGDASGTDSPETTFLPAGAAAHSILIVPIASPMHHHGLLGFQERGP